MTGPRLRAAFSTKVIGYGGTLVVAAAFWGIIGQPLWDKSLNKASNVSSIQQSSTGIGYVRDAGEWAPLFVLLIMAVAFLTAAVFRSRRRR